jgi:hypothetical protein
LRRSASRMEDTNAVLAALRHPPKVHSVNGVTICLPFMKAGSCAYPDCRHAHLALCERPACTIWSRYGVCTRGDECWFQHPVAGETVSPVRVCPCVTRACSILRVCARV